MTNTIIKFNKAKNLYNEGKFEEALFTVDQIQFEPSLSLEDILKADKLKSKILIQQGNLEQGFEVAKELFRKSRAHNQRILELDGLLNQFDATCRLGRLEKASKLEKAVNDHIFSLKQFNVDEKELLERKAHFLRLQGDYQFAKNEYENALECYKESLELSDSLNKKKLAAWALNNMGNIYYYQNKLDLALKKYNQSLQIRQGLDLKLDTIKSLGNVGICHFAKGELDLALDYYKQGLKLLEEEDKTDIRARYLDIISMVLQRKNRYDEAYRYAKKSLKIQKKLTNDKEMAHTLNSLAIIEIKRGNLDSAIKYTKESLKIKNKLGDKKEIALAHDTLGEIYLTKGNINKALDCFEVGMYLKEKIGFEVGISHSLVYIGEIYIQLSDFFTAEECFKKALGLVIEDKQLRAKILKSLVKLHLLAQSGSGVSLAKSYLEELDELNQKEDDLVIKLYHGISKARYLCETGDLNSAKQILSEIIKMDIINHKDYLEAVKTQIGVLFKIYKKERNQEELECLKEFLRKVQALAREKGNFGLLIKVNLVESKLLLVENRIQDAIHLIKANKQLAEEKGLLRLKKLSEKTEIKVIDKVKENDSHKFGTDLENKIACIEKSLNNFGFC